MNPGKLRHRVTFVQDQEVPDGMGGVTVQPVDVATVWAAVEPLQGRERYAAQQVQAETSHRVTIRYRAGLNTAMRIRFQGRMFNILAIIDPEERREQLQLLCAEVTAQ